MNIAPLGAAGLPALVALQRLAYRVEADLLGVATLPPLAETPADLAASGESLLAAHGVRPLTPQERGQTPNPAEEGSDPGLVGAIGWVREGGRVSICRLVVHPQAFRRGVATALLDALEVQEEDATQWRVTTGAHNGPARRLYEQRGFAVVSERDAPGGVRVVEYRRPH